MRQKTLRIKSDGNAARYGKQLIAVVSLALIAIPTAIAASGGSHLAPGTLRISYGIFLTGVCLLAGFGIGTFLFSRFSPVPMLALRKRLILFDRMFLKSAEDGTILHSVYWDYALDGNRYVIELYANGLVPDMAVTRQKLSEYLSKMLLDYQETDGRARYILGDLPKRYDGIALLREGVF